MGVIKVNATAPVKAVTLEAVVTRANGTVENLGTIAHWHRNPVLRWLHKLTNRR